VRARVADFADSSGSSNGLSLAASPTDAAGSGETLDVIALSCSTGLGSAGSALDEGGDGVEDEMLAGEEGVEPLGSSVLPVD
jgi:hypothetical protein